MRLEHLELTDHRNIAHAVLDPDPNLTVLCGAQRPGQDQFAGSHMAAHRRQEVSGAPRTPSSSAAAANFPCWKVPLRRRGSEKTIRLTVGCQGQSAPGAHRQAQRAWTRAGPPLWRAISRPWSLSRTFWRWSRAGPRGGAGFSIRRSARCSGPIWWLCGGTCGWWPRKNALLKSYEITPNGALLLGRLQRAAGPVRRADHGPPAENSWRRWPLRRRRTTPKFPTGRRCSPLRYQCCAEAPTADALADKLAAVRSAELRAGVLSDGDPHRDGPGTCSWTASPPGSLAARASSAAVCWP